MRILQVVTLASAGGAFGGPLTVAMEQCEALQEQGHDVTLLTGWDGIAEARPARYQLVRAKARNVAPPLGNSALVSPSLVRWVRQHRDEFDIVHVHLGRDMVSLPAAAALGSGRPFVLQTHGMVMPDARLRAKVVDGLLTNRVLQRVSAVLYLTDVEHRGLLELGIPEAKLRELRNGIGFDPSHVHPPPQAPIVLSFCARLHPRKRVGAFLDLAALLHSSEPGRYKFFVAGPNEGGGELPVVEQFQRSHPEVGVEYRGALSATGARELLAASDIFVLPSVDEPFPMTVLEALALGTPAIVTDTCGIAADLSAVGAARVTDGSPNELAVAVRSLITDWAGASRRAREAIQAHYSIGSITRHLVEYYVSIAESI